MLWFQGACTVRAGLDCRSGETMSSGAGAPRSQGWSCYRLPPDQEDKVPAIVFAQIQSLLPDLQDLPM